MTGQIYMIRHNVTGRMYIGRSQDVTKRTNAHFKLLRKGEHPVEDMQDDFDKHGENYSVSVLGNASTNPKLETEMMDKYQSCVRGIGYNYNDPHINRENRKKAKLVKLVSGLNETQAAYAYTFLSKMFGAADT